MIRQISAEAGFASAFISAKALTGSHLVGVFRFYAGAWHLRYSRLGMECFFGSYNRPRVDVAGKNKVVSFEIPALGIGFKAPFEGEEDQTDFASLLALLEFVDLNRKLFSDRSLQIFGDNLHVVEQVNSGRTPVAEFEQFLTKALAYREKFRFSLDWTPSGSNPAHNPNNNPANNQ